MIVRPHAGPVGRARRADLRCPVMKRSHSALLLSTRSGYHLALTRECRLFVLDHAWSAVTESAESRTAQGRIEEIVNCWLAGLRAELVEAFGPLDSCFGSGMTAAADILAGHACLGLPELRIVADGATETIRRNRAQALVQFPLLAPSFQLSMTPHAGWTEFTQMVDDGLPLMRVLPSLLHCKPWMLRAIRGLAASDIAPFEDPRSLLAAMHWLTPERSPQGREYGQLRYVDDTFTDAEHGCWLVFAIRRSVLAHGWRVVDLDGMPHLIDYGRFVHAVAGGHRGMDSARRIDEALGHPSLAQVQRLSDEWHEIELGLRAARAGDRAVPARRSWRPLFEGDIEVGGLHFRCLRSRAELEAQGRDQRNCLASYGSHCEIGLAHIVSIRQGPQTLATMELHLERGPGDQRHIRIRQLSTARNGRAPAAVIEAAQELVGRVSSMDLSGFVTADAIEQTGRDREALRVFRSTLMTQGDAGLERYRSCLQVNAAQPRLWQQVRERWGTSAVARG